MANLIFKIWNSSRTIKKFVTVRDGGDGLYETVILKASQKLNINGSSLVLEGDGTYVDDDDTLRVMAKETLILLEPNEIWKSIDSISTCSTVTVGSNISLELSELSQGNLSFENQAENNLSVEKQHSSINSWEKFTIPWYKISTFGIKALQKNKRDVKVITEVVHTVADEIRSIGSNIPAKHLKNIAKQICKEYPLSLEDRDDDEIVIGEGYHGMFFKLQDRIKYLNRCCHNKRSSNEISSKCNIPINKRRKMLAMKAGCSNWEPTSETITLEESQNAEMHLKLINLDSEFDQETLRMLEMTYSNQRLFLNNGDHPSIIEIRETWPFLLCQQGIYWHFSKLMSKSDELQINIQDLSKNILLKSKKILTFGIQKLYINEIHETENEILLDILSIITMFFKEELNLLYRKISNLQEIKDFDSNSLAIVEINNTAGQDSNSSNFIMEKQCINKESTTLRNALQLMFALYFNFNLEYPLKISLTLEFIQIYFLKIQPHAGSKNTRRNSKMKLLSLINKLR